jgi:hypothetical protein
MLDNNTQVTVKSLPKLLKNFIEGAKRHVKKASKKQKKGDGFDLSSFNATFTINPAAVGRCVEYRFTEKDPESPSDGGASTTGSADDHVQGPDLAPPVRNWSLFLDDLDPEAFRHHNCSVYLLNLLAVQDLWNTERVCTFSA